MSVQIEDGNLNNYIIKLKEHNEYLKGRVEELENEVINERKERGIREFLEEKVKALEIEVTFKFYYFHKSEVFVSQNFSSCSRKIF